MAGGPSIAFIGDADSVLGFRALGVHAEVPASPEQAVQAFRSLVSRGASVIAVTEDFLDVLRDEIELAAGRPVPAVIILPGVRGSKGRGGETIRRQITRAVGVDLMADDR